MPTPPLSLSLWGAFRGIDGREGKRGMREREEKEEKPRGQAEFNTQEKKGPHRVPT